MENRNLLFIAFSFRALFAKYRRGDRDALLRSARAAIFHLFYLSLAEHPCPRLLHTLETATRIFDSSLQVINAERINNEQITGVAFLRKGARERKSC